MADPISRIPSEFRVQPATGDKKTAPSAPPPAAQPPSGTAPKLPSDGYFSHEGVGFALTLGYNGLATTFAIWRSVDFIVALNGGQVKPPMILGIVPLGEVSLPFPPVSSFNLTAKQRRPLMLATATAGMADIATDFAEAYHPNPYSAFSGFSVPLFQPTLDPMADAQRTRQMLAYSVYLGHSPEDKPLRVISLIYYISRQLADAELTQVKDGSQASQSSNASIPECEWKGVCETGKDERMLNAPFDVAVPVNEGLRSPFLAATGMHSLLLNEDGNPTPGNFAAGVLVSIAGLFLRHDDGQDWNLSGPEGNYFLRDLAFQGGGFLLAWATQDDPQTQFRLTSTIPTLLMAFKTPEAMDILYRMEDAGKYDDMFALGGLFFKDFQNFMAGLSAMNALFDKDKSWAARLTPGLIAVAGVTATTIRMGDLGVQAREPQYRADEMGFLSALDPKLVGVLAFVGGASAFFVGAGSKALIHLIAPRAFNNSRNHVANGGTQDWHGQPTNLNFSVAPVLLPTTTEGVLAPGFQAGLTVDF